MGALSENDEGAHRVARTIGLDPSAWRWSSVSVGSGQVAGCRRWIFERDGEERVVVTKSPSHDETSRATAKLLKLYLRETSFYKELRPQVDIPTPHIDFVEYSADDDDFLIVMEDLSNSRPVDQLAGITRHDAETALAALVGLHASTAGRTDLFSLPWIGGVSAELGPLYFQSLPGLFTQFLERYDDVLDHETRSAVTLIRDKFVELMTGIALATPVVTCVIHGDYRTDNLIFDARGGEVPFAVVDWQTLGSGSPMSDVAFFLTTSLDTEDRRATERELIEFYLEHLRARGVQLSTADAHVEYARATVGPIIMLVSASIFVERTERGDQMFLTMIRRAVDAATEWGVFAGVS